MSKKQPKSVGAQVECVLDGEDRSSLWWHSPAYKETPCRWISCMQKVAFAMGSPFITVATCCGWWFCSDWFSTGMLNTSSFSSFASLECRNHLSHFVGSGTEAQRALVTSCSIYAYQHLMNMLGYLDAWVYFMGLFQLVCPMLVD